MDRIFAAVLIVLWVIGSVMKAVKAMKTPASTTTTPAPKATGVLRARRIPGLPATASAAGFAGRSVGTRNPNQSRAIDGAAPRLAEGAEYGPIVAERDADRASELRFANEVNQLIQSEPTRRPANMPATASMTRPDSNSKLLPQLAQIGLNRALLINAVVLAEVLGPPRSKRR